MSSTAISSLPAYNTPLLTERCGEVYCSLTRDCFVINCSSCSVEFNLLSCNLFMKHVKECLPAAIHELVEQNLQSQETHDLASTCAKQESNGNIDYKSEPIDPLITIKEEDVSSIPNADTDQLMDFEEDCENKKQERNSESESEDNKSEAPDNNDKFANILSSRKENEVIITLIEEYRKHPCLWNSEFKAVGRFQSYDALKKIMRSVNAKHNQNFTKTQIRYKLFHLRRSYVRSVRSLKIYEKKYPNKKPKPRIWYFDRISFIDNGTSKDGADQSRKSENLEAIIENEAMADEEIHSDIEAEVLHNLEELSSESEARKDNSWRSSKTSITRKKSLLEAVIEEYKKRPSLWQIGSTKSSRKKHLSGVCAAINEKFNTNLKCRSLDREMTAVISLYQKLFRRGESDENEDSKRKLWLVDMLSFIKFQDFESNESYERQDEPIDSETSSVKNNSSDHEEAYQRASTIKNKVILLRIIELYKEATVLWDPSHPQHILRNVQKEFIEAINEKLREEYGCCLTVKDFRNQIQFLKTSYFRAVRNEVVQKQGNVTRSNSFKPFFFEEMSFLKPFVTKSWLAQPDLQTAVDPAEDFNTLCENESLMLSFIDLYKSHACLWDRSHKDRKNPSAHAVAYSEIIDMFKRNSEDYTEERVRAAINFLHSTAANTHKMLDSKKSPVWFYEHLQFFKNTSRNKNKFCTHCNKQFRSLAAYEKHKIEIVGEYPYKCDICNAGFVTKSKYVYHQITHNQPYKCDQCDFQAFDKHNLEVHMRRHKRMYMFRCNECDKGFVTSSELSRHIRMHTGKKAYVCEICGKELAEKSGYLRHLKQHRNKRNYKCKLCDSAFNTDKSLKSHMAVHSTERTHACDNCGKTFKLRKTLIQHKALHMEEKKHECTICGKLFAQKAGVYSHMKSHGQAIGS